MIELKNCEIWDWFWGEKFEIGMGEIFYLFTWIWPHPYLQSHPPILIMANLLWKNPDSPWGEITVNGKYRLRVRGDGDGLEIPSWFGK